MHAVNIINSILLISMHIIDHVGSSFVYQGIHMSIKRDFFSFFGCAIFLELGSKRNFYGTPVAVFKLPQLFTARFSPRNY